MRVLVTGGTGTVGSRVVERLNASGEADVRVLTSSPGKLDGLAEGVEGAVGDLSDRESLDAALRGVDRLFLLTPLHPDEADLGRNAIDAAADAGVGRVVLMSVHHAEEGAHIPHFGSKVEMARALEERGLEHTVLKPNNFFQNDLMVLDVIREHGVYPHPLGPVGTSRVDVADIADAAVECLLSPEARERDLPVAGPDVLSGQDCAREWSRALGREVVYGGHDLDAWAGMVSESLPEWLVDDLRTMYAFFLEKGLVATEDDLAATRRVLGREPRSFSDFVDSVAAG